MVNTTPLDPAPTWENNLGIIEWDMNPARIHAAGRRHPVAYMRPAVQYMEILIGAGDDIFRPNTIESILLALQRYVEALHIFGPVPIYIPALRKPRSLRHNQQASKLDTFSNAMVDRELDFLF
ncbi:hypothetical protein ANO14919_041380 [Xylariales sp. No.14919]|nr:hypothetical protein ANO14919_041380 [Xylariales sp. No.14919]